MIWTITSPEIADATFTATLVPDKGRSRKVAWPIPPAPFITGPLKLLVEALFADEAVARSRWEQTGLTALDAGYWDGLRFTGTPTKAGVDVTETHGWGLALAVERDGDPQEVSDTSPTLRSVK